MRRREFITLVGGAAAAWPLAAHAQQSERLVTIGILGIAALPPIDTFRHTLKALGYIEGKNVRFEHRYAGGRNERFPELANDLVGLKVDVILTWGTDAALAAKQATATIPIVMGAIGDPIASGIVTSLAHPAANMTGLTSFAGELEAKRLELLKEALPDCLGLPYSSTRSVAIWRSRCRARDAVRKCCKYRSPLTRSATPRRSMLRSRSWRRIGSTRYWCRGTRSL